MLQGSQQKFFLKSTLTPFSSNLSSFLSPVLRRNREDAGITLLTPLLNVYILNLPLNLPFCGLNDPNFANLSFKKVISQTFPRAHLKNHTCVEITSMSRHRHRHAEMNNVLHS